MSRVRQYGSIPCEPGGFVMQVQNRLTCHPSATPLMDSQARASRTAGRGGIGVWSAPTAAASSMSIARRFMREGEGGGMDALAIMGVVAKRDLQERSGVLPEHPLPIWPRFLPRLPLAARVAIDAGGPHLLGLFISKCLMIVGGADTAGHQSRLTSEHSTSGRSLAMHFSGALIAGMRVSSLLVTHAFARAFGPRRAV